MASRATTIGTRNAASILRVIIEQVERDNPFVIAKTLRVVVR
jgi:hypothetical protein